MSRPTKTVTDAGGDPYVLRDPWPVVSGSVAQDRTAQEVLRRALLAVLCLTAATLPIGRATGGSVATLIAGEMVVLGTAFALWRRLASPLWVMRAATVGTVVVMTLGLRATVATMASGVDAPLGMRLLAYGVIASGLALLVLRPWRGVAVSVVVQAGWLGMIASEPATRALLQPSGEVFAAARYSLIVLALLWGLVRTYSLLRQERDRLRENARRARAIEQQRQVAGERRAREIAEAAHELRGPLSTLALGAETLASSDERLPRDDRQQIVAVLQHAARRLDQRTIDLLRAARGSEAMSMTRQRVDPVAEVARTLEDLALVTADHHLRLHGEAAGQTALLDPAGLDHIVTNLVHNATKYAPAGTTIDVVVRREDRTTVVIVADEGPGVPDDLRDELFSPYARSDAHSEVDGTGVGLCVTRSWARRHGGDARLLATEAGATFEVRLPDPADA